MRSCWRKIIWSSSCYLEKRINIFMSATLFHLAQFSQSFELFFRLWDHLSSLTPSPVCCLEFSLRVGESAWPILRFDLILRRSNQWNYWHVSHCASSSLCLCTIWQFICPSPKLLDWVKMLNSCWWPTRCVLWTKNISVFLWKTFEMLFVKAVAFVFM